MVVAVGRAVGGETREALIGLAGLGDDRGVVQMEFLVGKTLGVETQEAPLVGLLVGGGLVDDGGMLLVIVAAGTAVGRETGEALIGLVGGALGNARGMLAAVVAVGKTMGVETQEAFFIGLVDNGGMLSMVVAAVKAVGGGETWETLIGLVRGWISDNRGVLPLVVAIGIWETSRFNVGSRSFGINNVRAFSRRMAVSSV
jgi:hypothetical protein